MINKDILSLINTLALEIMIKLDGDYSLSDDPTKTKVLTTLRTENNLQEQIEQSLKLKVEEIIQYFDYKVYKISCGAERFPSGGKIIAGWSTDKMNEKKPEEVKK